MIYYLLYLKIKKRHFIYVAWEFQLYIDIRSQCVYPHYIKQVDL